MIAWLKAAWGALVGFFGFWKSAATGQAAEARAADLEKHLAASIKGRQDEAARWAAVVAEKDRQIGELRREIEKRTRPGDVAGWWDDRVRDGGTDPAGGHGP